MPDKLLHLQTQTQAIRFQSILRHADRCAAATDFLEHPMDNSRRWLGVKPMMLWARMQCEPFLDINKIAYVEMKQIYDLLLKTGALHLSTAELKELSLTPCVSPDGFITNIQIAILYAAGNTNAVAPEFAMRTLHRIIKTVPAKIADVLDVDPSYLDWVNPQSGQTALHLACTTATEGSDIRIECIRQLIMFVGSINPRHYYFTVEPITSPPEVVGLLMAARMEWDDFRMAHLPNQISLSIPNLLQELIELITDYAC